MDQLPVLAEIVASSESSNMATLRAVGIWTVKHSAMIDTAAAVWRVLKVDNHNMNYNCVLRQVMSARRRLKKRITKRVIRWQIRKAIEIMVNNCLCGIEDCCTIKADMLG